MKRKNWALLLLCAVLLTSALCPSVYAAANDLVDLPAENHWSYRPIFWAYDRGVTAGIDETHFGPHEPVTRAQAVMMIWRLKRNPEPAGTTSMPFQDIKQGAYYYNAVQYAWVQKWVGGVSTDRFDPNAVCTRAQLVAILGKAFQLLPMPRSDYHDGDRYLVKDAEDFLDVDKNSYYYGALWNFCAVGIIAGTDETHFSPNETCTRDQFVTILYRIYQSGIFY